MQIDEVNYVLMHTHCKSTQDPAYAGPRSGNKLIGWVLQSMEVVKRWELTMAFEGRCEQLR